MKKKSTKMEMMCDHGSGCCCGNCGDCGSDYYGGGKWWKVGKLVVGLVLLASVLMPTQVPLQWAVGLLGLWLVVKASWKLMKGG